MRILRSKFLRAALVLAGTFLFFRFGIRPAVPWSVVTLYMTITVFAVLIYVSSDSDSWEAFLHPLRSTVVDDSRRPLRLALAVALPLLAGYYTYSRAAAKGEAPPELRAVHPAPPASISFRGEAVSVQGLENPLRKDAANFKTHVAEGAWIYIKNCVYCHGDNLDGNGHFAHAFNPRPANFTDPGTIAMLQESYLFWRIAKGGPGLPKESAPWNSVMPAWEDRLSQDDIWKVIMYLYDATGSQPRRWEARGEGIQRVSPGTAEGRGIWNGAGAEASGAEQGDPAAGKAIYEKKCALCHGEHGKGDGPGAPTLDPKPRDFTRGAYKIRTTASGHAPTDADLFRIITDGMPGTSMPSWRNLPERDRWNLVAYLKSFAPETFRQAPRVAALPKEVPPSPESIARGKEMFEAIECHTCHGKAGLGDGPSAPELKDEQGHPVRPANLTKPWTFRGGDSPKEIATRLTTGLMGTPMPSFIDSVERPEDVWHLANYVRSLGPEKPGFATLLPVRPAQGEIPDDPTAPFWAQVRPATFPLAGQVIVDPRNFTPSIDTIAVRAVYTDAEIAFQLAWDDPAASQPDPGGKKLLDQVALQFPARPSVGPSDANDRPHVLLGDSGNPVYLLHWNGQGGVGEARANGPGALTPLEKTEVRARGKVRYQDGRYQLVLRRPRVAGTAAAGPSFPVGAFIPIAFLAWDGENGETAAKMSLSAWYYLRLDPPASPARWLYPPLAAMAVGGLEFWGIRWARRRVRHSPPGLFT